MVPQVTCGFFPKGPTSYVWLHESVPTPLNYRELWRAEHLSGRAQEHYPAFWDGKQKIQRRENNKIRKGETD